MNAFHAVLVGLAGLGGLWVVLGIASSFNLKKVVCGSDGTLSTSKFQLVLWTVVIVFSYLTLFAFKAVDSQFIDLTLTPNLLIVMGISATTAVAAKGIAVGNATAAAKAKGLVVIPGAAGPVLLPGALPSLAGLFQADDGTPDLGKIQLMIWTMIGVCIYLAMVQYQLTHGIRKMPDIGQTLMVLMGLGNGTYLGKKIAGNGGS
jgi:hypothetical protein